MHELAIGARVEGSVRLDDVDVYDPEVDPVQLRRVVGMVFQRPNPFPTMSIFDNVAAGLRLTGRLPRGHVQEVVERSLRRAALWTRSRTSSAPMARRCRAVSSSACASPGPSPSIPRSS